MTCQLVPVLVLALLVSCDCAQAADRICGSRLAEVLAVVCRGRGYYWEIEKRPVRGTGDGANTAASRGKRSVVQECCYRTCTISELESYCNVGDGMSRGAGGPLGRGVLSDIIRAPSSGSAASSSSSSSSAAAVGSYRQRFTHGLLSKPFFFVTPRRTGGLFDAAGKK